MNITEHWPEVKKLFRNSFRSSFHYAVASVDKNGVPHVTPIGSLILGAPGQGLYFEEFIRKLPHNSQTNNNICVLAVNSSKWFWFRSLLRGRFADPPAIRLHGKLGESRQATEREIALWQKRVKAVRFTRGHALMWENMKTVREIQFTEMEPVILGEMTRDSWCKSA